MQIPRKLMKSYRISPRNDYPLFLPPKIASAVQLYGDMTIFDASASFLSPRIGLSKKQRPKMDYAVRLYVIVRMTFFVVGFPMALLLAAKFCEKSSMKASPVWARLSCLESLFCAVKL